MASRFKLDENLPRDAEELFLRAGHSVETVLAEQLGGKADSSVLDACRREDRILVTYDLDFADACACPPARHQGIWILRPARRSVPRTLARLSRALQLIATESPQQRLWIIDDARVRIRE